MTKITCETVDRYFCNDSCESSAPPLEWAEVTAQTFPHQFLITDLAVFDIATRAVCRTRQHERFSIAALHTSHPISAPDTSAQRTRSRQDPLPTNHTSTHRLQPVSTIKPSNTFVLDFMSQLSARFVDGSKHVVGLCSVSRPNAPNRLVLCVLCSRFVVTSVMLCWMWP